MSGLSGLGRVVRRMLPVACLLLVISPSRGSDRTMASMKIDEHSFKCITAMTHVRHFYVDNLLGNVAATAAVAQAGSGDYPPGSVIQLVPTEAMVKQEKGFNPATRDWEFFALDVDHSGSKIFARGFQNVNNRFGLNCFTCHKASQAKFDFVCEQQHGCAPIPITRAMFGALQRTDPRCTNPDEVSAADQASLKQLGLIVNAMKASAKPAGKSEAKSIVDSDKAVKTNP